MTWGCMGLGIVDEAAMYEFVLYCTVYTLPISRSLLSGLGSSARSSREQGLMVRYPRTLENWKMGLDLETQKAIPLLHSPVESSAALWSAVA